MNIYKKALLIFSLNVTIIAQTPIDPIQNALDSNLKGRAVLDTSIKYLDLETSLKKTGLKKCLKPTVSVMKHFLKERDFSFFIKYNNTDVNNYPLKIVFNSNYDFSKKQDPMNGILTVKEIQGNCVGNINYNAKMSLSCKNIIGQNSLDKKIISFKKNATFSSYLVSLNNNVELILQDIEKEKKCILTRIESFSL